MNPKISVFLKLKTKKMSSFVLPSFSPNTPNKIGNDIKVSGKNTLINTENICRFRAAIADESIDTRVDGKKMFCVRADNARAFSCMMIGFTPMETFDSNTTAYFGSKEGFTGCGIRLHDGTLFYPVDKNHNIIDWNSSRKAKEIIVILTISNNGTKKEIRFLVDGHETKSTDVSEHLQGDFLFPAICLYIHNQQFTTIPIDQIEIRTPEIDELIKEYQQQQNKNQISLLPSVSSEINDQVISQLRQQISDYQRILIQEEEKQMQEMRKSYEEQLKHARLQMDEFRRDFLKQVEMKEKQIESKDQQFQREREISNKQLEVERAENHQLRNLLQHKKDEMSAMEIYHLKRESGQRREREEEFKVKKERNEDELEQPIQQNNKKNNKKTKK